MEIFNKKEIEKLDIILKLILPNINTNMPDANLILNDLDINNKIDFIEDHSPAFPEKRMLLWLKKKLKIF